MIGHVERLHRYDNPTTNVDNVHLFCALKWTVSTSILNIKSSVLKAIVKTTGKTSAKEPPRTTPAQDRSRRSATRRTYHHGDLRKTLIEAGLDLAREGGPQAIVLREATRRAGVAPNAAYRHFANHDALFAAVRAAALGRAAQAIETEMDVVKKSRNAQQHSRALLAAVGRGYLGFALTETGWFRTAFASGALDVTLPIEQQEDARTAKMGLNPFQLLGYALDAMTDSGVLPAERRPMAEYLAWSTVHGMALLMIDGPLRHATHEQHAALAKRLLEMVEKGI